jgi:alpha-L-fucosidase 2
MPIRFICLLVLGALTSLWTAGRDPQLSAESPVYVTAPQQAFDPVSVETREDDAVAEPEDPLSLWYHQPAEKWQEALPIGNGRLGAMVFGGWTCERLQFNEDTVWKGEPHEYHREGAAKFLPQIRQLLGAGKQREAESLAMQHFMSDPLRQFAYQPFGDVLIDFPELGQVANYRRDLNLDTAVTSVAYTVGGANYRREAFVSHPDQALVWHMQADKPGSVNFAVRLDSPHKQSQVEAVEDGYLALTGQVSGGAIRFEARLHIATGTGL